MRCKGLLGTPGTPHADLLGLSPGDVLRQLGDTPCRDALRALQSSGSSAGLTPKRSSDDGSSTARSSRHAVLEARRSRRGRLSSDDLFAEILEPTSMAQSPRVASASCLSMSSAAAAAEAAESPRFSVPQLPIVRRISFSAPSPSADAVRDKMQVRPRVLFRIRRLEYNAAP